MTCAASAVFRMWMDAPATHVVASDVSEPPFVAETPAVLSTTPSPVGQEPPVACVVVDVMWTVKLLAACVVPAGTVAGPQFSTPAVIEHEPPQPEPWLAICQLSPAFAGNWSRIATPYASPLPEFDTVSVKPIWSPAFTCALSAAFTILMAGAATQVDALALSEPAFAVDTEAVLSTSPLPDGQTPP